MVGWLGGQNARANKRKKKNRIIGIVGFEVDEKNPGDNNRSQQWNCMVYTRDHQQIKMKENQHNKLSQNEILKQIFQQKPVRQDEIPFVIKDKGR